ncbi:MAG: hypothetical protein JWM21_1476 [Acidobacteria bacterium]|nr:hypothetical protein [Acidobacteriota bacterium]
MSLLDSSTSDPSAESQSRSVVLLGVLAALVVTGLFFVGYAVLRKQHQQKVIAADQSQVSRSVEPKGPPKAQILVDEALIKGDQTVVGGTVKNISNESLDNLGVNLELVRRQDGGIQKTVVQVEPAQLAPQQEGRYSLQLRSADFITVKLAGLKSGANPSLVAFVAAPGQKRPFEKLESKTIIVGRPAVGKKGGFLNSPDNPGRVP